jgi:Flp pilus assembly pilin Flp
MKKLLRFLKEEEGMETVEYAVVAALVILVGIAVWSLLGQTISEKISQLTSSMG